MAEVGTCADEAVAAEAPVVPAAAAADASVGQVDATATTFHVSSKDFVRTAEVKVQAWLAITSGVTLKRVCKSKPWSYAFVTVSHEDVDRFKEKIAGATFKNEDHPVVVKDEQRGAKKRDGADGDEEPDRKKRRKDKKDHATFPEGHVPTLKDLKDRIGKRKGNKDDTVLQRAAPLFEFPYETQLTMKGTYVKSAVRTFTKRTIELCSNVGREPPEWTSFEWSRALKAQIGCSCLLDDAIGTPESHLRGYRNKCEFTVGVDEEGQAEVGAIVRVKDQGALIVAPPDELPHVPAEMKRLCSALRACVRASPFATFDRRHGEKTGVWRTVMVRQTPAGELLVMVQLTTLKPEDKEKFLQALTAALAPPELRVVSLYLQLNDEVTDAARGDAPLELVHGLPRLQMPLLGLNFEIGPLSFFQANSATATLLFGKAIEWLGPKPAETIVLDVCCGVGTIGLCMAARCRQVIGVELIPEAVESAKANAALNKIENASFHAGRAELILPDLLKGLEPGTEVCAMVDPPRPGLHKDVLKALRSCAQLTRIVYVSCNPDSLVEDVAKLTTPREDDEDDFVPVRAVAVDMFPHTVHTEMILLLERRSRVADPRVAANASAAEASAAPAAPAAPVSAEAAGTNASPAGALGGEAPTAPAAAAASDGAAGATSGEAA